MLFWQTQTPFFKANSVRNSKFALFELVSSNLAGIEFCLGWIIVYLSETCFFYFSWKKTFWQMNNSSAIGQVVFVRQNILPRLLFFTKGKSFPQDAYSPPVIWLLRLRQLKLFFKKVKTFWGEVSIQFWQAVENFSHKVQTILQQNVRKCTA